MLYWYPPVILRLVFSLGVGMKGYLYTILTSSSNHEVSISFRCRNGGNWRMPIQYRGIPSFLQLKKILTSWLLEDANIE
jgi:hypothetical protein